METLVKNGNKKRETFVVGVFIVLAFLNIDMTWQFHVDQ